MRFRVTDEHHWAHTFDADTPAELCAGVEAALSRWQGEGDSRAHPLFALRRQLVAIDRWEAERLARADTRCDGRARLRAEADDRRARARRAAEKARGASLRLHVQGLSGLWLVPADRYPAPAARKALDHSASLFDQATRTHRRGTRVARLARWGGEKTPPDRRRYGSAR